MVCHFPKVFLQPRYGRYEMLLHVMATIHDAKQHSGDGIVQFLDANHRWREDYVVHIIATSAFLRIHLQENKGNYRLYVQALETLRSTISLHGLFSTDVAMRHDEQVIGSFFM